MSKPCTCVITSTSIDACESCESAIRTAFENFIVPQGYTIKLKKCECGSKNPVGQGHSTWCDLFKKEM